MQHRIWIATVVLAACARETPPPPRDSVTLSAAPASRDTASVAAVDSTPAPKAEEDSAMQAWLKENDFPLPPPPKVEGYPIIYRNSCVGEICGAERVVLACADIPLHESASKDSPRTMVLKKGDTAVAGQDLHVIAPGIVVLKREFTLDHVVSEEGNRVPLADTIHFARGDTVFLELYGQLGTWHARYRGRKLVLEEFWGAPKKWDSIGGVGTDSANAVLRSEHYMDTWWPVTLPGGRTGWKLQDQNVDYNTIRWRYTYNRWEASDRCP
jgi:hypothetical protein